MPDRIMSVRSYVVAFSFFIAAFLVVQTLVVHQFYWRTPLPENQIGELFLLRQQPTPPPPPIRQPTAPTGRTSETSARTIDSVLRERRREKPAAKCGLHYYYHIGKNGGQSILQWQKEIYDLNSGKVILELIDQQLHVYERDYNDQPWREKFDRIDQIVRSGSLQHPGNANWLTIHHHYRAPGLKFFMARLREWKAVLETYGCTAILTTNLREPLSRAKSMLAYNKVPSEQFKGFVTHFSGQARFLMYNTCQPRNDTNFPEWCAAHYVTKHFLSDSELQELYGYLLEFDVIGNTTDHDKFVETMELLMGWNNMNHSEALPQGKAPVKNKSVPQYNLTDEMVQMIEPSLRTDYKLWHRIFGTEK